MLLVDTNVLVDVLENDPNWAEWSVQQLRSQAQVHDLAINPVIYAELGAAFESIDELDAAIHDLGIRVDEIPRAALFLAGKAYLKYRRAGGGKSGILSDFFLGAHAAVNRWTILTRDATRYRGYFPTVKLLTP